MTIAGMISGLQIRTSKRGNRFAQFRFEDRSGGIKGVVLGENFDKLSSCWPTTGCSSPRATSRPPRARSRRSRSTTSNRSTKLRRDSGPRALNITIPATVPTKRYFRGSLYNLLERDRGRCSVFLTMNAGETRVRLDAEALGVAGSRALQRELEDRGCMSSGSLGSLTQSRRDRKELQTRVTP